MKIPQRPADEAKRQQELEATGLLDTGPDRHFDDVTRTIATVLGVPVSFISLIDKDRQWFKSRLGLDVSELPRDMSFCGHVVASAEPLVVEDTRSHEDFLDHPYVVDEPRVGFYAGFPLLTSTGRVLGTLCAVDHEARPLTAAERELLRLLSEQVSRLIELQTQTDIQRQELQDFAEQTNTAVIYVADGGMVAWASARARQILGLGGDLEVEPVALIDCLKESALDWGEVEGLLSEGRAVRGMEATVARAGGGDRRVSLDFTARHLADHSSRTRCAITVVDEPVDLFDALQRYEVLFEVALDLFCSIDGRLRFDLLNPAWEAALGWSVDELRSQPLSSFVHPDDVDEAIQAAQSLFEASVEEVAFECRFRHRSGSWHVLSWRGALFDGTVVATARDVTQEVNARERIRFSNRLLRLISMLQRAYIEEGGTSDRWWERVLEGLNALTESEYGFIGTLEEDEDGRFLRTNAITDISWNEQTRRFYEERREEGLEFRNLETLFGRVISSGQTLVSNDVAGDPRAGGRPEGHPELKHFLGLSCGSQESAVGMIGLANRPGGYSAELVADLQVAAFFVESAIKQSRQELERATAESRLNAVVNSTSDVILSFDERGMILAVNPAIEGVFGYEPEQVQGRQVSELLPAWEEQFGRAAVGERPRLEALHRIRRVSKVTGRRADGEDFWLEISVSEFVEHQQLYFTMILRDVSDRVRAEEALRESTHQLSEALDIARAGHWKYDPRADVFTFNDNFYRIFGTSAERVGGCEMSAAEYAKRFVHPEDRSIVAREVERALKANDPTEDRQLEHRFLYEDGTTGMLAVRYFVTMNESGGVETLHGVNQDITERWQRALDRENLREQQLINDELAQKIAELDRNRLLSTLTSECVELVQRAISLEEGLEIIARFLGQMYPDGESGLYVLAGEVDNFELHSHCRRGARSGRPPHIDAQACWAIRTRRVYAWWPGSTHIRCGHLGEEDETITLCAPLTSRDKIVAMVTVEVRVGGGSESDEVQVERVRSPFESMVQNMSSALSSIALRDSLRRLALTDELTELRNRRAFNTDVQRQLGRARREGESLVVAMVDIDHFKQVNDEHGHEEGDRVLRAVAAEMSACFRQEDITGRLGGEEFGLVLFGATVEEASRRLEAFRGSVSRRCRIPGGAVTVSIGYCHAKAAEIRTLNEALSRADQALYAAKAAGRDRVVYVGDLEEDV